MEVFKYNEIKVKRVDEFMTKLLKANSTEEKVQLYHQYQTEIDSMTPLDIFYLDFYSNNSPLSVTEIKQSANKFVNLFHKGIANSPKSTHPFFNEIAAESKRIEAHLAKIKPYLHADIIKNHLSDLIKIFDECAAFKLKYLKFQNIIFPHLETVLPSTKPLEVLWELHDDAILMQKSILNLLHQQDPTSEEIIKQIGIYHYLIFGINQKEDLILFPVMSQLLSTDKLNQIYNECIDAGFVFLNEKLEKIPESKPLTKEMFLNCKTGKMSFEQLIKMLDHLPFDITFVDNNNIVKYYNESKKRHFPRTPSVIGREVKNCHPPKSVQIVEQIINDFRHHKKDFEEFWINIKGKTIYIAYYAVRDEDNQYLGVLEVSQDISRLTKITGEKRLLS